MSSTSMNTVRKSLNVTQINFTQGPREGRYNSKADMSKKPDATEVRRWELGKSRKRRSVEANNSQGVERLSGW
ncbi:hypothetical protein E4U31_002106 [Claviceps sp. LM219 group G6]|nr:hypothetical protein E4U31_002106 [Claviceps sp. LM219 group G6]